jgi:sugar-specific transcriptional regulator TrmB
MRRVDTRVRPNQEFGVHRSPIEKLVRIGFSEYEARAYIALLAESPVTGYRLAKLSGIPRSRIYGVADKLAARGAVVKLAQENSVRYAPVPAGEFLEHLQREHRAIMTSLRDDLSHCTSQPDLDHVWNITGRANIIARARCIINQARSRVYLATWTATFPALRPALEDAIDRHVQVVVYTTGQLTLPGGRVVVTPVAEGASEEGRALGLILVRDGQEVLISEWLETDQVLASWTHNPALVSIAEHHLVHGGRRRFLTPASGSH